ncbi:MAG: hypothetical protein AB8F78_18940 [Saprospiraceae bacterium]
MLSSSCTKNDCCTNISTNVTIHYQTQSGEDLINSSTEFDEENIKLYYKNGEEYEYIYNANLSAPGNYRLDEESSGDLILTIYPSAYYSNNMSTTLIELNENLVDTLVGEFRLTDNSQVLERAWLNGEEMDRGFLVVKR